MKYIHVYSNNAYCESKRFKGTPNTLVLTDEQYNSLGITHKMQNGQIVEMTAEEKLSVQAVNSYE